MLFALLAGACAALGAAAAPAPLQFQRVMLTQGPLGPERVSADYYRQDMVCLRYFLTGVQMGADGQCDLALAVKLTDPNGALFGQQSAPAQGNVPLGGGCVVGFFTLPLDHPYLPPGEWTLEMAVTDNHSKQTTKAIRKFLYKPLDLAVVRAGFFYDDQLKYPARPTVAIAGQGLYFQGRVVGFAKDEGSHGNTALDVALHFLDAEGHEVGKPQELHLQQKIEEPVNPLECYNFRFNIVPNRAGKFTVRVVAYDKIAKKTATYEVPLHVQE